MTDRTPFSKWSEGGEADPHGEYYHKEIDTICLPHVDSIHLASKLMSCGSDIMAIVILTAAKERLRWLSRRLYKLSTSHDEVNAERFLLPMGELTDDELANHFFITESAESLAAGNQRILWLVSCIDRIQKIDEKYHSNEALI